MLVKASYMLELLAALPVRIPAKIKHTHTCILFLEPMHLKERETSVHEV